ncbi:uncharacterized protein LOC128162210 [Crassostrea angulata]|uniref:uncharacterized protein LOC128162210 n=1 Tax=Magallana angulata TaxID=2784310 RepID=UPI0022B1569B|nr:uncharacterized protein LOC128162210 [Crassostrea angulata]
MAARLCPVVNCLYNMFFFCCREMAKTKTTSAEQLKKCPFCSFKSRSHSEWKDHMADCYETRHFCRRCDYSTDKKVNYIRHLKRNHPDEVEKGQGSQQSDNAEGIKSSEDSLSRDLHEDESSDEEEWLSQEPDITIDEEPGTSGPSPCEKAVDPTVRKRTQPMPVYTPDRCKTPRLMTPRAKLQIRLFRQIQLYIPSRSRQQPLSGSTDARQSL